MKTDETTPDDPYICDNMDAEPMEESKPLGFIEIIRSNKTNKKIDAIFQLNLFKRFVLFGTESHYKSATRRSINRWFITETNFRLYVEECKIKSIKHLSDVIDALDDKKYEKITEKTTENRRKRDEVISRMNLILTENAHHSPIGVIPYLLAKMYMLPNLRPVVAKSFLQVVKNTTDLLIFAHYLRKVSGNQNCIRRLLIEWYKLHSNNPQLLKDLLLVKGRAGWKHRDVIVHWKIPVPENEGILRILMGFEYDPSKVSDEKVSLVEKLVQLRNMNSRNHWLKLADSEDYIKDIGVDLCYNLKTMIINFDVLKVLIERLPFNDFIEHIPRMVQKTIYWTSISKELMMNALIDQLKNWKSKFGKAELDSANVLSIFVVWKWLNYQYHIYYGDGKSLIEESLSEKKNCFPISTLDLASIIGTIFEDELFKRSGEILFAFNIPGTDVEESGANLPKKPTNQELKRPFLFPNVIKATEFIQFLIFIFPNHRIAYKDKFYKISGRTFSTVENEFTKMRLSNLECLPPDSSKTYKNAICITFDGSVDLSDDGPLKTHKVEKIAILSIRDKDITQAKDKLNQRNLLVIKGLDSSFFPFIEKYFQLNCQL